MLLFNQLFLMRKFLWYNLKTSYVIVQQGEWNGENR